MRPLVLLSIALVACAMPVVASEPDSVNDDVLAIAYGYPDGGAYKWEGSGVPEAICYGGEQILPQGDGTFCCGYTLAVVFKAATARGLLDGRPVDDIRKLHQYWYGNSEESKETLVAYALEELQLGHSVEHDEAQPGDFVQFWRTSGSGHSVVFLKWVIEQGQRVGVEYRSSQKATGGIGDRREYFSDSTDAGGAAGKLDRDRFYIARLNPARPSNGDSLSTN